MNQFSHDPLVFSRRDFVRLGAGAAVLGFTGLPSFAADGSSLPEGTAPAPLGTPHFASRLQAFVWRNWPLVPLDRMAKVVGAKPEELREIGVALGLVEPPEITADQQSRSYLTVLRRNWHLLPYEQLLALLGWSAEQLAYTLRYDDGAFWKFGSLKPKCEPLRFAPMSLEERTRATAISLLLQEEFPGGVGGIQEPLFHFVSELSAPPKAAPAPQAKSPLSPRFCHSYFAPYGDPLLDGATDPYPDGYLARLVESGVDSVWLQVVLSKLAPFPWDAQESEHYEQRLRNLGALVARARRQGIGLYLYLNEPRARPLAFFEAHPELKGVPAKAAWEAGVATLCTSAPEVQKYLTEAVASICRAVPDLAGFFTITASEALTNCWSHGTGAECPRCSKRAPAEVIAELNGLFREGIRQAGSATQLIVWDWGWKDEWAPAAIERLPADVAFMSVSEWSIPIERGGVKHIIGEYAISAVGPGPRATKHWALAQARGLKTIAKIQANNTWELSSVPYIPAVESVARHAANLRGAKVDGIMLGWSLGGYPSPNLEVVAELGSHPEMNPVDAMRKVAHRRFGAESAAPVVTAWQAFSAAFSEFPYGSGLYVAPMQYGPSNLLWEKPTKFRAGPIGFPYDDLEGWRRPYPAEVFISQMDKVAEGFQKAVIELSSAAGHLRSKITKEEGAALKREIDVASAATLHFRSTANQARFVKTRDEAAAAKDQASAASLLEEMHRVLRSEIEAAKALYVIQMRDSRIGFEASNHYYYVPVDLVEKVVSCRWLMERLV